MGDEQRQGQDDDVDPSEQRPGGEDHDEDRHHPEEEAAERDGKERVAPAARSPLEHGRGGEEVQDEDTETEGGAGRSVHSPSQTGDENDRGSDHQPATDEVGRDPSLYRG